MKTITVSSYAKINLSLDVLGVLENGMHQVDMIMQELSFHDDVTVSYTPDPDRSKGDIEICLTTNRYYLPTDSRNIAYKAAALMIEKYGNHKDGGRILIDIFKRIPVAAGMAGGSGNCAAVLHGLNVIWDLKLGLKDLCDLGAELGSDVPFCVMGQAKRNHMLPNRIRRSKKAVSCARATGTGTEMVPLKGMKKAVVIAKPDIGVSTKEVYQGIDYCVIHQRPDTEELIEGLVHNDFDKILPNCINVLEEYTLKAYPEVERLKQKMWEINQPELVLMSGSGPTVFAVYDDLKSAMEASEKLRTMGYESYWTKSF